MLSKWAGGWRRVFFLHPFPCVCGVLRIGWIVARGGSLSICLRITNRFSSTTRQYRRVIHLEHDHLVTTSLLVNAPALLSVCSFLFLGRQGGHALMHACLLVCLHIVKDAPHSSTASVSVAMFLLRRCVSFFDPKPQVSLSLASFVHLLAS